MNYQRLELDEICNFLYGKGLLEAQRKGGATPVYGSNGIVGWHDQAVTKGKTIIIGRKGSIGEVHFSNLPCWPIDTTYYIEATKIPCDLNWLYYMLVALDLTHLNKSAAVPGLNRDDAYRKEIPFPSLLEQKRIAAILDKADRLRRQRRYVLELSNTYLQSVFSEMFGDSERNPNQWQIGKLFQLCDKIVDCPHATPIYTSNQTAYACIRSSDIQNGFLDWSTTKYIDRSEYEKRIRALVPMPKDVVYCREGARFGNAAVIPTGKQVCLGQRMLLLRAAPNIVTPEFIWAFLESESTKRQAIRLTGGSASPHLNVGDIKEFVTIIPPLTLQRKFAQIVQQFERLRAQQREAERQAEHLFQTLLYQAFEGNLDLGSGIVQDEVVEDSLQPSVVDSQLTYTFVRLQMNY